MSGCRGHDVYCDCPVVDGELADEVAEIFDDIVNVITDLRVGLVTQEYAVERIRMQAEKTARKVRDAA